MDDGKHLRSDLWRTNFVLFGLLIWVFIEGSALWRTGQPSAVARWTAAACAIPSTLFCLMGVASIRSIRKQLLAAGSKEI